MSRNEKKYGIILDNIKIFGEKVSPVVIEFDKGLNLVGGASDTGKTYLYQLVDSLLGKQELPKEIDEAKLYDQATIQISRESSVNTIIRDLKTSNFYYVEGEVIKRVNVKDLTPLSKKHKSDDKKKNGVSNILLDIMGCDYKKIKKNQKGTLVSYSYRNFAHLNMIDEDNIYTSKPYFLAGASKFIEPQEKESFLTSLSGIDDLSLEQFSKFFSSEKISGQLTEIKRQINKNNELIAQNESFHKTSFEEIEEKISKNKSIISNFRSQISSFEEKRSVVHERYIAITKDLNYSSEIVNRIKLLQKNYESDLKRIEFIGQADYYFNQLESYPCPICGEKTTHISEDLDSLIEIENGKLHAKLDGLRNTLEIAEHEILEKKEEQKKVKSEIDEISYQIEKEIQPMLSKTISDMEELILKRSALSGYEYLTQQIKELENRQKSLEEEKNNSKIEKGNTEIKLGNISLERLCEIVEELLQEWGLFKKVEVEFDSKSYDLIVNNKPKASYGKGFKSLINSAYVVANFLYAHEKELPYPGFVIIDSPLIVFSPKYKEKSDLSLEVTDLFYESIKKRFVDYQIIIFENKLPSEDVVNNIPTFIEFTHTEEFGRYGLFPNQVEYEK
ncbi:hypothetical protein ACSSI0_000914 [Enterococcus hirae]